MQKTKNHNKNSSDSEKIPLKTHHWILGHVRTSAGLVPLISHHISPVDKWGSFKVRWGINRMNYRVTPGIYAIGKPDKQSPVLVTANYKMSFDCLRSRLQKVDAWILVLDTNGINVWCAAGKGQFSTEEIVNKIKETRLGEIVAHRRVIVPQLAAPGVTAHRVKKESGFQVIYGPVRAADLPFFLENKLKAIESMRRTRFSLKDRLVLTPMEIVGHFKYFVVLFLLVTLVYQIQSFNISIWTYLMKGFRFALYLTPAYIMGTFITPILLPFIPGRSFALKGLIVSGAFYMIWYFSRLPVPEHGRLPLFLIALGISSFTAMNFTGASNYTSLSGVQKEIKYALPLQLTGIILGILLLAISNFIRQGVSL